MAEPPRLLDEIQPGDLEDLRLSILQSGIAPKYDGAGAESIIPVLSSQALIHSTISSQEVSLVDGTSKWRNKLMNIETPQNSIKRAPEVLITESAAAIGQPL
jgi:hypothetical protein